MYLSSWKKECFRSTFELMFDDKQQNVDILQLKMNVLNNQMQMLEMEAITSVDA